MLTSAQLRLFFDYGEVLELKLTVPVKNYVEAINSIYDYPGNVEHG